MPTRKPAIPVNELGAKALKSEEVDSKTTLDCIQALNKLVDSSGVVRNAAADDMARGAARASTMGPDPTGSLVA